MLAFRDFLDFWFSRYGPKSDWKKSIFKKFLKIEELSWGAKNWVILESGFRKKIFENFWIVGGLWQVVKLGKTRYFKNFENFLKIQDWSVSDWLGIFEKYYVSCCTLIFLSIFGMLSFGWKGRQIRPKIVFSENFFEKIWNLQAK